MHLWAKMTMVVLIPCTACHDPSQNEPELTAEAASTDARAENDEGESLVEVQDTEQAPSLESCVPLELTQGLTYSPQMVGPVVKEGRFTSHGLSVPLGAAETEDAFMLSLYPMRVGDALPLGTWDLARSTPTGCTACILVFEDGGKYGHARAFFQHAGSLVIDASSDLEHGMLRASLERVVLVEYDMDPDSPTYGPLQGGPCLEMQGSIESH